MVSLQYYIFKKLQNKNGIIKQSLFVSTTQILVKYQIVKY